MPKRKFKKGKRRQERVAEARRAKVAAVRGSPFIAEREAEPLGEVLEPGGRDNDPPIWEMRGRAHPISDRSIIEQALTRA